MPVTGSFTTIDPDTQISVRTNIGDGQVVGVGAPIILQFDGPIADKAAVEKALHITTVPPTIGSWAWLPDDNGARVHWRPQNYWAPGTSVHVDAQLYGLDFGDGAYGAGDVSLDFTIGRSQIVKAVAPSHRMQVVRDGVTVMDIPVSYGEGNENRNVTRSGIHVVSEMHEDFLMSNPPYYENVRERWAVRISNNGEFIHANPLTVGVQGASNVTNGCITCRCPTPRSTSGPPCTEIRWRSAAPASTCPPRTATSTTGQSTGRRGRRCPRWCESRVRHG